MKTCVLILDNLRSVENTASIFRTADGLGVQKIYLVGTTPTPLDRFGRKRKDFAKVALGAEETVAWEYVSDADPVVFVLKNRGMPIISLEQTDTSTDVRTHTAPEEKFALVVGNEVDGVSKEFLDASEHAVEIEMRGKKESLNVAVATGIALHTLLG